MSTTGKSIIRLFLAAALVLPMSWSCKDDSLLNEMEDLKNKLEQLENEQNQNQGEDENGEELDDLKEQIDLIIERLLALEEQMNAEIKALNDLLRGKIFITEVSRDVATGITTVKLSNGSELNLLPEKDLESYVTYIELSDGVKYWGYIDADGSKKLFLDAEGEPIPVEGVMPEVIVKDGETYLVIGGVEYPLVGNSIFSGYDVHVDELTGEVYAVTFTFGEGMKFTVTLDGACGFNFVQPAGWSTVIIEDYFVSNGLTERVQVEMRGVADYVFQAPDGWKIKEYEDIYMAATYFDITAPTVEMVESGAAAAEGTLKVVAVLEDGKSVISRLNLSTQPFKEFSVSYGEVNVTMFNGVQKFVYGVCLASEYDETTILQTAEGLLEAYDYPKGYGVTNFNMENVALSEIAGEELVPGSEYVFWAIPALYYQTEEDAGYYLKEGTFVSSTFKYSSIKFEITEETIKDAQVSMDLQGIDAYYLGLMTKEDFYLDDILFGLDIGMYEKRTTPMSCEMSVFKLAGVTGESATDYIVWLAVAEDGKIYSAEDVLLYEFSTLNLAPGSSVQITASDVTPADIEITAQLDAAGAEAIYYAFLTKNTASKYTDDAARANYLFQYGKSVKAASVQVKASETLSKISPESEYVLFAVATDAAGKYSNVVAHECTTEAVTYNDLTIDITLAANDPGNVVLNISSEGAVGYLYWIGKTSDNTWKSANYLGGSAATAQKYLYLNQNADRFTSVMEAYPVVDGVITMTDLATKQEYVIVAMAKDQNGKCSQAVEFKFETRSIALGQIVPSTDPKWVAATPVIEWIPQSFHQATGQALDGEYSYKFSCGTEYTAYVLSGAEGYFLADDGTTYNDLTVDQKIIAIVEMTDKIKDYEILYDEELWETEGYPAGHYLYHAPHGCPLFGYGVIFSGDSESHKNVCSKPDKCVDYAGGIHGTRQLDVYYNTGEPVTFRVPGAFTVDDVDKLFVALRDKDGNFYEPYYIDVPDEYFENSAE